MEATRQQQRVLDQPVLDRLNQPTGELKFKTSSIDFGTAIRGESINLSFEFVNQGEGPVVIQGIHAPCGCIVVDDLSYKDYSVGESGHISVRVDTSHFEGSFSKSLVVMTSQVKGNTKLLSVRGNIISEWSVNPPILDFGRLTVEQTTLSRDVIIRKNSDLPLKLLDLIYDEELLAVSIKDLKDHWLMSVQTKEEAAQTMSFLKTDVWLKNTSQHLPLLRIPVRASFPEHISYEPQYVEFGSIALNKSKIKELKLSADDEFTIDQWRFELIVNDEPIPAKKVAEILKLQDSKVNQKSSSENLKVRRNLKIEMQNSAQMGLKGSAYGKLILSTSLRKKQDMIIDFYAFFGG